MPIEPPGQKFLNEFIESLTSMHEADQTVAEVLQRLHKAGSLRSTDIVAALRSARGSHGKHDATTQA